MSDLAISSAAALTGDTIAGADLIPVLDVSAASGSKGSYITAADLFTGRPSLGLRNAGTGAYDLTLAVNTTLTAARTLTLVPADAAISLTIPASGTVALLGTANVFTVGQTITQGTANASVLTSTGYSVTGSGTTAMLDLAGTWNTSGVVSAVKVNITNTASANYSKFYDGQIGGTSLASLGHHGGNSGVISLRGSSGGDWSIQARSYGWNFYRDTTWVAQIYGTSATDGVLYIDSYCDFGTGDTLLRLRRASGTVTRGAFTFESGTTACNLYVHNTYTSTTSYERGVFGFTTNVLNIGTQKGSGGGTARGLALVTDDTARLSISATGIINVTGIPTSASGLSSGDVYSNGGVLTVV